MADLPRSIWINGVERRIVKTVGAPLGQHGYQAIHVSADAFSTTPVAEHSVPRGWLYDTTMPRCYTGGHWYSHKAGGDLAPPKGH